MPALKELAPLLTELTALRARVEELLVENAALRAQIDQLAGDSKRQAAPFSKGQRKARPKRPGRKPGHGRFTFPTLPTPDQWTAPPIEVRLPDPACSCCGEPLQEHRVELAAITDLPPQPKPVVQPYRVWVYRCPGCDTTVHAPHSDLAPDQFGATAHRIGPRAMAAAPATHYGPGVPVRKVPAVLRLYAGVPLTQSAITQDASRRVSGPIGSMYQALRDSIPKADVVSTDDTGWRVGGERAHLMIFETDTATVFQVRARHRNEEVREVIGDDDPGVLATDRGESYDAKELEGVKQQKCIPHALRSIDRVLEIKRGRARHFGARLKGLLKEGLQLWHDYHDHHGRLAGFDVRARQHRAAVTRHLEPRRLRDGDNQRLLDQFGGHHAQGNLLRFLEDPRVEPTTNRSERGFRFAVIQRKVSQCAKTAGGAEAFAVFASVIKTATRQGKDVVEWLSGPFRGIAPKSCPT
jgi:transposase